MVVRERAWRTVYLAFVHHVESAGRSLLAFYKFDSYKMPERVLVDAKTSAYPNCF